MHANRKFERRVLQLYAQGWRFWVSSKSPSKMNPNPSSPPWPLAVPLGGLVLIIRRRVSP